MLGLQRTINLNVVALKVILQPTNNVDAFKVIRTDEGKLKQPLTTAAEGKKGNPTPKGVDSFNKLYDLQNFYQWPRNDKTHRSTTTNK